MEETIPAQNPFSLEQDYHIGLSISSLVSMPSVPIAVGFCKKEGAIFRVVLVFPVPNLILLVVRGEHKMSEDKSVFCKVL